MQSALKNTNIENKRDQEMLIVEEMIVSYCKTRHGYKNKLCRECEELLRYSQIRSQKCPFMEEKTFCSNCKVHCYKPDMRQKIRRIMRDRGLWMLMHHPILSIRHLYADIKEKRNLKKV